MTSTPSPSLQALSLPPSSPAKRHSFSNVSTSPIIRDYAYRSSSTYSRRPPPNPAMTSNPSPSFTSMLAARRAASTHSSDGDKPVLSIDLPSAFSPDCTPAAREHTPFFEGMSFTSPKLHTRRKSVSFAVGGVSTPLTLSPKSNEDQEKLASPPLTPVTPYASLSRVRSSSALTTTSTTASAATNSTSATCPIPRSMRGRSSTPQTSLSLITSDEWRGSNRSTSSSRSNSSIGLCPELSESPSSVSSEDMFASNASSSSVSLTSNGVEQGEDTSLKRTRSATVSIEPSSTPETRKRPNALRNVASHAVLGVNKFFSLASPSRASPPAFDAVPPHIDVQTRSSGLIGSRPDVDGPLTPALLRYIRSIEVAYTPGSTSCPQYQKAYMALQRMTSKLSAPTSALSSPLPSPRHAQLHSASATSMPASPLPASLAAMGGGNSAKRRSAPLPLTAKSAYVQVPRLTMKISSNQRIDVIYADGRRMSMTVNSNDDDEDETVLMNRIAAYAAALSRASCI